MSGLTADQVDALVELVHDHGLWKTQRHRALNARQSVLVVLLYLRHNLAQHLLAELFGYYSNRFILAAGDRLANPAWWL